MENRGKIIHREYAAQIRDYTGLRWGSITPTDIDLVLDFGGILFVLGELKYKNTVLKYGQRLALERINDAIEKSRSACYCLILSHNNKPPEDIDTANSWVIEYRYQQAWKKTNTRITCRQFIEGLMGKYFLDGRYYNREASGNNWQF